MPIGSNSRNCSETMLAVQLQEALAPVFGLVSDHGKRRYGLLMPIFTGFLVLWFPLHAHPSNAQVGLVCQHEMAGLIA